MIDGDFHTFGTAAFTLTFSLDIKTVFIHWCPSQIRVWDDYIRLCASVLVHIGEITFYVLHIVCHHKSACVHHDSKFLWNTFEYHFQFHISSSAMEIPQNYMLEHVVFFRVTWHLVLLSRALVQTVHPGQSARFTKTAKYTQTGWVLPWILAKSYLIILQPVFAVGHNNTMAQSKFTLYVSK